MFHDYWELVMSLRPFLGARQDTLLDLQTVADDRDVHCDHANKLMGIWRQVIFMLKCDPDFMYKRYHLDSFVIYLAMAVLKASFPLSKIHPNLFQFARRVRHIP